MLIAAVGVVTDICRAMRVNELNQFFKELMTLLYKALKGMVELNSAFLDTVGYWNYAATFSS